MLHFWTDSRIVSVENSKRRETTSQIASSACLCSSRSIGHHYVNVLRKNKVAKNGKKNQSFANKNRRYQLKNFKSMNPIRRQRMLQPSFHNLLFNQGEVVVGGGGWRRKQKNVHTSGKILATPLIRDCAIIIRKGGS